MIPVMMRFWMPHGAAGPTGPHLFYFDTEADETIDVDDVVDYFDNKVTNPTYGTLINSWVDVDDPLLGNGSMRANASINQYARYFIFDTPFDFESFKGKFTWEGFVQIKDAFDDEYANMQTFIMGFGTNDFAYGPYAAVYFKAGANGGMSFYLPGIADYSAPTFVKPTDETEVFHWAISVDGSDLYFGLDGDVEKYNGTFTFSTMVPRQDNLYMIGSNDTVSSTSRKGPEVQDNVRITHGVARYTDTTNGYTVPGATYTD